ncbi:tRNA (5-methylaminomethyl-2-thiouridine)(34)-methyltransferase MnmD [Chrysiogenes arsenatis]|uniref:tRNA (5-methylaminomethyl-2-thiouridine)(34)-methyltransferase MnmD n=1 Tax=Chrysiogenes arsenatis TaxID=309797 RepID=UPI0004240B9A|nr:MnmC family methyltransferase [Chrysiogenes arsenatis]
MDDHAKFSVVTSDGSATLYSSEFQEHYHSVRDGAWRESLEKHVKPGLELIGFRQRSHLTVLDICFGLGYNTLVTLWYLDQQRYQGTVAIHAPEMDGALLNALPTLLYPTELAPYRACLDGIARERYYQCGSVKVVVYEGDARVYIKQAHEMFDLVYQDAFSPRKNPELWSYEYFQAVRACCCDHAVLTTYSQATPIRLALQMAGFTLYHPPVLRDSGIRPGTIASPSLLELVPIDLAGKLQRSDSAYPLRDPEMNGERTILWQQSERYGRE